jgi:hypothetical protein
MALIENSIFYISPMYEFSHSQGHSRHFPDHDMSGLAPLADVLGDAAKCQARRHCELTFVMNDVLE